MRDTKKYAAPVNEVIARLVKVQSDPLAAITIFKHDPTGLGAQISRCILALKFAYISGRRSVFLDDTMHPYTSCYEPISPLPVPAVDLSLLPRVDMEGRSSEAVAFFDFWKFWSDEEAKNFFFTYTPEAMDVYGEKKYLIFDGSVFSYMKLLPHFQKYIDEAQARLKLDKYISIHYRRGDKKVETPYVPTKKYVERIIKQTKANNIKNVYLASDSNNAVKELNLKKYGINLIFDKSEVRYNNANHKFLRSNIEMAQQETETSIKNIYLLAGGVIVVGQTNAHFATLAGALAQVRCVNSLATDLIPGDLMLNNFFTRIFYNLKIKLREILKKILPSRALQYFKQKF